MKIATIFLCLFWSVQYVAGQGQDQIFLEKKLSVESSHGTTGATTIPTVSADKAFMTISVSETAVDGTAIKFNSSSLLFNLQTGDVVKQYKNAELHFIENNLLLGNYGDIWDKKIPVADFSSVISGKTTSYLNRSTLEKQRTINLPAGHIFGGSQQGYIFSAKAEGVTTNSFLWKDTPEGLKQIGKYPISSAKISKDGTLISGIQIATRKILIYDIATARIKKQMSVKGGIPFVAQLIEGNKLIYSTFSNQFNTQTGRPSFKVTVYDLATEKEIAHYSNAGGVFIVDDVEKTMLIHSNISGKITLVDLSDFSVIATDTFAFINKENIQAALTKPSVSIKVGSGEHFLIGNPSGIINLVSTKEKKVIADIYVDHEDWAVVARDGRVDGTPGALDKLEWHEYNSNGKVINRTSLDAAFANFFTPGLLPSLLRDETGNISELKQQIASTPTVEILDPSDAIETSEQQVRVSVRATQHGDPIKDIELFVNGKLYGGDERGLKLAKSDNEKTFTVSLVPGKNSISARAISQKNYESASDFVAVNYKVQQTGSSLHILAIGINEYKNSSYNLNYAVADAGAIVQSIRQQAAQIFSDVQVHTILNGQATKQKVMQEFRQIAQNSKPEDVFVFFYAGHGVMSEKGQKDFYLALHEVTQLYGKEGQLKDKGISAAELKTLTSHVKAQKQMIILDACQSGAAVETFALRGAAEEKAMVQLARSTGVTLLASTGSQQYATEFEQLGHGVFTYALLGGLSGKADGGSRDGKITVKELEAYLNDAIPELTQKYKGSAQYPRSWSQGQDFPVVVIE